MLDRLMKLKPKALYLVYEGTLLFVRNKAVAWREKLTGEEVGKAITLAKKSKTQQQALYFKNKQVIDEKRVIRLKLNMEEKEKEKH